MKTSARLDARSAIFQSFYHTAPKVFIGYDRLAFAGIDDPQLRITFDTNLRWRDTDVDLRLGDTARAPIALPCGDVLMEVKISRRAAVALCHLSTSGRSRVVFKYGACCCVTSCPAGVHDQCLKEDTAQCLLDLRKRIDAVSFLICTAVSLLLDVSTALVSTCRNSRTTQELRCHARDLPAVVQLVIMLVSGNPARASPWWVRWAIALARAGAQRRKEIGRCSSRWLSALGDRHGYVAVARRHGVCDRLGGDAAASTAK